MSPVAPLSPAGPGGRRRIGRGYRVGRGRKGAVVGETRVDALGKGLKVEKGGGDMEKIR